MRHVNSNMTRFVIEGIARGELAASFSTLIGDQQLAEAYRDLEEQTAALVPPGDRPFVVAAFLKSKALAYTQGFIAAYRSGTEF